MYLRFLRVGLVACLTGLLVACSGGSKEADSSSPDALFTLSGTVGDTDAAITATDANGATVVETVSDTTSRYALAIPQGAALPITITARGGTNLVTGGSTGFDLLGVAFTASANTINVSPLTTFAVHIAECSGSVNVSSIDRGWSIIDQLLGLGLTPTFNPMSEPVGSSNAAKLTLANTALSEMLSRTVAALAGAGTTVPAADVLRQVACDLQVDNLLNGAGQGIDAQVIATFRAAEAAVLLEVVAGSLSIAGQDATAFMDQAIATILGTSGVTVGDVAITERRIDEARATLSLFLVHLTDPEILTLALLFHGSDPTSVASTITATLDNAHQVVLWGMPGRIALANASVFTALTDRMEQQNQSASPLISLDASEASVSNGTPVTLSWASTAADRCSASDGWSGEVGTGGSSTTAGLTQPTNYVLQCVGLGGVSRATTSVSVIDPDPAPITTLTVADQTIDSGNATSLSWSSVNASECNASGAWTGPKTNAGSQSTGALFTAQTFTLTCSGSGGSDTASVTVTVNAPPPPPPPPVPNVVLSAVDTVIDAGDSTVLNWSSTNASSCQASNGWSGSKQTTGSEDVGPLSTDTTFTLTCSGAGGSANASVTVQVNPAAPPPTVSLNAADLVVDNGDSTTLTWSSTGTNTCTANGGWTGNKATGGTEPVGPLTAITTFTLTCSGAGGSANASVTVQVNPTAPPPTVSLSAADLLVNNGDSTTLTWSSTDTTTCTANGGWTGNKATGGTEAVGPLTAITTFTLTCSGSGGSDTASVTVTVNAPPPPLPVPNVVLSAVDTVIDAGDSTVLNWSSTNASSCQASNGWSGSKQTTGSEDVGPLSTDTTFTLTCSGAGGSANASATVQVNPAAPPPTVSLSAADLLVDNGDSTTLTWSSTDTTTCTATGGWTGNKATGGTEAVGPLTAITTFSLTCSGTGGNAVTMISVNVNGVLSLSWVAPTENVDGTPLTDLAGYRIYYGDNSQTYPNTTDVNDANATNFTLTVPSGSYYVAMTALDLDGNESAYSNEVLKMTE